MFHRFHDRFGTAGVVIGVIALIAALGGTALAAGGLTKSQEKQVTKIAKKYAGKPGAAGTNGTNGSPGTNGTNGKDGSNGQSVTGVAATAGECPSGGVKYTSVSGNNAVCNGKEGKQGKEGSPWTAGGTLPSEKTETGAWEGSFEPTGIYSGVQFPISFTIPLAAALPEANIQVNPESYDGTDNTGTEHEQCPGKASEPKAKAGFLCIYTTNSAAPFNLALPQVNTAAGVVESLINLTGPEIEGADSGTWAVTAE